MQLRTRLVLCALHQVGLLLQLHALQLQLLLQLDLLAHSPLLALLHHKR